MSNNNEQNGRQPPLLQHTAPPSDPRLRNVSVPDQQKKKFCRDFIWGICTKGNKCKFPHVLEFESMKETLKFCHDHQNRTAGCIRADCTYLHTSREEENLFLTTGQIPKDLVDRYAAMSTINMAPDGVQAMNDYMRQPPPPPPCTNVHPPRMTAPLPPMLLQPPPPPPPTITTTPGCPSAPIYTAPPPPHNPPPVFSQPPPPLPVEFSRPALTSGALNNEGAFKRPAEPCKAGPNKARKLEESKVDTHCENCVQRELRIEVYRQEMQKLECEKELQSFIYEKKSDEYDIATSLLKSVLSPQAFLIIEEYVEGSTQATQVQEFLAQISQGQSFVSSPPPTVGVEENSLMQTLSAHLRRVNPVNNLTTNFRNAIPEVLQNGISSPSSSTSDRIQTAGSRTNNIISSELGRPSASNMTGSGMNGVNLLNGQKMDGMTSTPLVNVNNYASTGASQTYPTPNLGAVNTSQACLPGHTPAAAPAPPAAYLAYRPTVPPPSRPYYPQSYPPSATSVPMSYTPIRVGPNPQATTRPSTTSAPQFQNQQYNPVMGRYPTHYFPPFQ